MLPVRPMLPIAMAGTRRNSQWKKRIGLLWGPGPWRVRGPVGPWALGRPAGGPVGPRARGPVAGPWVCGWARGAGLR